MLERISKVQGIGLLHDADGRKFAFKKSTLIYAENGRGKSTVAGILRSASSNDPEMLRSRATIDGTLAPAVELQFDSGHKVNLRSGIWSENRPELVVFDAEFIEKNVHTGGSINTTQRKNLLAFALGATSVTSQIKLDQANQKAKKAIDGVRLLEKELSGYHAGIALSAFEKMSLVEITEPHLRLLRKRLDAAIGIAAIKGRPVPSVLSLPTFMLDNLFDILESSISDIHEDAEKLVRTQLQRIGKANAEHWISQGVQLEEDENCPYCGQSLDGVELIQAYRTFFNKAYENQKSLVGRLEAGIMKRTADSIVESFSANVASAQAQAVAWKEQTSDEYEKISFNEVLAKELISQLRALLLGLAVAKVLQPAEPAIVSSQKETAKILWTKIQTLMTATNEQIEKVCGSINTYKQNLELESITKIKQEILNLEVAGKRCDPRVVELLTELALLRKKSAEAVGFKQKEKDRLSRIMQDTLSEYEQSINRLLSRFGASFSIQNMGTNYRGGAPRTEYCLSLRGKEVPVEGGTPSFSTALSEGDRRTLAFAFFVACVLADPNLSQKSVIIDDPMCSFDLNRKQETRQVLKDIYNNSNQLIVLAHDLYFLRDFQDDLLKSNVTSLAAFQLSHAVGQYSDFASIDLAKECASQYHRDHQLLSDFTTGQPGCDKQAAAKAIRPMLEGYLHRRFPGLMPRGLMFGQSIDLIEQADAMSPLAYALPIATELRAINSFAWQFHHNTNPDADTVNAERGEIITYAQRALNVIYRGFVA